MTQEGSSNDVSSEKTGFQGSGGTEGGVGLFLGGLAMTAVSLWMFLDSVIVTTGGMGWISGMMGMGITTSAGIVFVPFFIGVCALFYDAKQEWAWWVTFLGIVMIVIEIISRIHFLMTGKLSHILLMIGLFAAGTGLIMRSYKPIAHKS